MCTSTSRTSGLVGIIYNTLNVEMFAHYIFSCISCRALDEQKYDMSENLIHFKLNGINY